MENAKKQQLIEGVKKLILKENPQLESHPELKKKIDEFFNKFSTSVPKKETLKESKEIVIPGKIKLLAEEMKKINKKIDLRNPLIDAEGKSIVEGVKEKADELVTEAVKTRWQNLFGYSIPGDEKR